MSGDLAINTPTALVQCQNVTITWTGGVGMFPISQPGRITAKEQNHIMWDTLHQVLSQEHPPRKYTL